MNRTTYTIKAFTLLAKNMITGKRIPFHSKKMSVTEATLPGNAKYLFNGIARTSKAILKGECRLHWLR